MRDADDHAATVRAFLDNCVPGLTTPDVADAQAALDALIAALAGSNTNATRSPSQTKLSLIAPPTTGDPAL